MDHLPATDRVGFSKQTSLKKRIVSKHANHSIDYVSLHNNYVIVIARGQGFMAVNQPSPRAQPEDKVCLRCHKSLATRAITIIHVYPT